MPSDRHRRSLIAAPTPAPFRRERASEAAVPTELPSGAIEELEAVTPRTLPVRTAPPARSRTPAPLAARAVPLPGPELPGGRPMNPLWWVPLTFVGSVGVTVTLTLTAWFLLVSPRLHAAIEVRAGVAAARPAEPPAPVAAPPLRVAEPVVEPVAAPSTPPEPAPLPPPTWTLARWQRPEPVAAVAAVVAAPTLTPRIEAPADPPPARVEPVPPPVEPSPARVEPRPAPTAARALDGRYAGSAGGKPLLLDLAFEGDGRVVATLQRGTAAPVTTTGRYALSGDRATVAFVEPVDGGASYSAMVSAAGAAGRIAFPTGKTQRFVAVR